MPSSRNQPFIVAEMSANHNGSLDRALHLVEAAAIAGADAIKVQTWTSGTMCVSDYRLDHGPWAGRLLRELYAEAHLPWEWHSFIFKHARKLGLIPFSAAFDIPSVDFLETLDVDRHKVASFELVDLPLIRHMATKRKPMILSTGMASFAEIEAAFRTANEFIGAPRITLLKCTSAYPAEAADANLHSMHGIGGGPFGLSDHTQGIGVAIAAVVRGATYIEKHLTLSRADGGLDAGFSLEPSEFQQMVTECRRAADAIGQFTYGPGPNESLDLRRSLWVAKPIRKGERSLVLGDNVVSARPALGMHCGADICNMVALRDLQPGEPLTRADVDYGSYTA